ncbi:hypothetical protein [Caballeronia zhejiangensis]|uniref:Uncharacterized protein n=1 Tax=Caballeronia zhejiangensis TaxID=871203 RepID=A0A656QL22_9BURK|nr:hypothetical protein [Caballeronia zhejiangensis]KDR31541.1 hypothetical protein BG60_29005 [Caballeronia zhejiangensis]
MKRPSFQFYPGDWTMNGKLRRCSHAEKGVWVDTLCLLHVQPEYGIARWTLAEVAHAIGCPISALHTLIDKGILKGADTGSLVAPFVYVPRSGRRDGTAITLIPAQPGPLWYSSRMVRDEYVRTHTGGTTRFPSKRSPSRVHGEYQGEEQGERQGEEQGEYEGERQGEYQSDGSLSSSSSSVLKTKKHTRVPRFDAQAHLVSCGARTDLAKDWLALRADKRAKPTATAIAGIEREAAKAGITLDDALRICCERGWASLRAEWLTAKPTVANGPPRKNATRNRSVLSELDGPALDAMALDLGIAASRPGESMETFVGRIRAALAGRDQLH